MKNKEEKILFCKKCNTNTIHIDNRCMSCGRKNEDNKKLVNNEKN